MKMQSSVASCGPTAMVNALSALGMEYSIETCEKLCRTSATTGTSTSKLMAALKTIPSLKPVRLYERRPASALFHLNGSIALGRPVIVCTDSSEHWTTVVGQLGVGLANMRYLLADSADLDLVLSYDTKQLLERWGPPYLGVVL